MKKEYQQWFDTHQSLMDGLDNHSAELYAMLDDDPPPPPPEGRVDVLWWPNRNTTAGATAFPLTIRPREYIKDVVEYLQENGYNSVSVGAQAWSPKQANEHPILPGGPVEGPEWKKNLETLLDETARHENFWVQLIPTFGYKQYDTDPDGKEFAWHRDHIDEIVAIIKANDFKHVYFSVMNEFKHPLTDDDLGDTDIYRLGQHIKKHTGLPVSTDHGGREKDKKTGERIWKAYYPQAWLGFDYYCWHPTRNPEPTARQFQKAANRWPNKTLLYNETVCYASDYMLQRYPHQVGRGTIANKGRGSEDDRKQVIRDIKRHIQSAGVRSRFFFHSLWLGIRAEGIGWIPVY